MRYALAMIATILFVGSCSHQKIPTHPYGKRSEWYRSTPGEDETSGRVIKASTKGNTAILRFNRATFRFSPPKGWSELKRTGFYGYNSVTFEDSQKKKSVEFKAFATRQYDRSDLVLIGGLGGIWDQEDSTVSLRPLDGFSVEVLRNGSKITDGENMYDDVSVPIGSYVPVAPGNYVSIGEYESETLGKFAVAAVVEDGYYAEVTLKGYTSEADARHFLKECFRGYRFSRLPIKFKNKRR